MRLLATLVLFLLLPLAASAQQASPWGNGAPSTTIAASRVRSSRCMRTRMARCPRASSCACWTCRRAPTRRAMPAGARHGKPVVGMVIAWGLRADGDAWSGGRILDPDNGKEYAVKFTPSTAAASSRCAATSASRCSAAPRCGSANRPEAAHARAIIRDPPRARPHPAPCLARSSPPSPCHANGALHLGHLVGYIQADIWVRAAHVGRPRAFRQRRRHPRRAIVMLAAEKAGLTRRPSSPACQESHERDLRAFGVGIDHYDSTNSARNRALTETSIAGSGPTAISRGVRLSNSSTTRSRACSCPTATSGHLPELRHAGPVRRQLQAYCGATYAPTDLKEPKSVLSGATPGCANRALLLRGRPLRGFPARVARWRRGRAGVKAKLREWLDAEGGLRAWDISRDAPYFGFEIPGAPGKYFYVWLDAPIGYLSQLPGAVRGARHRLRRRLPARRPHFGRDAPLHRQGHRPSTACSGRRCCTARASARRRACTSMAT